jgi:hypothetical protein
LKKLEEPYAVILNKINTPRKSSGNDGSVLVMESCISSIIDLHSSDDIPLYEIFIQLNALEQLKEAYNCFRSKVCTSINSLKYYCLILLC